MTGEPTITVVGNLTADLEVRQTQGGKAVAAFTVAATPRAYKDGQWVDGETLFQRCNIWNEPAENMARSAGKGTRVIVTGALKSRNFVTKEGENRTVVELEVQEVGLSLRYAAGRLTQADPRGQHQQPPAQAYGAPPGSYQHGGGMAEQGQWQQPPQQQQQRRQQGNPYEHQQQQQGGWPEQGGAYNEPPF
jgi:single-strand DNA-binding protein